MKYGRSFLPFWLTHSNQRYGVTILELVVVLAILVAIAGMTIPLLSSTLDTTSIQAAQASLGRIRDQVMRYWNDCSHFDAFSLDQRPVYLADLLQAPDFVIADETKLFNPDTRLGWHGPYLAPTNHVYVTNEARRFLGIYGAEGDLAVNDPWGNPFVIQDVDPSTPPGSPRDVRILSAGPDGVIDTDPTTPSSVLVTMDSNDDVYLAVTLR